MCKLIIDLKELLLQMNFLKVFHAWIEWKKFHVSPIILNIKIRNVLNVTILFVLVYWWIENKLLIILRNIIYDGTRISAFINLLIYLFNDELIFSTISYSKFSLHFVIHFMIHLIVDKLIYLYSYKFSNSFIIHPIN